MEISVTLNLSALNYSAVVRLYRALTSAAVYTSELDEIVAYVVSRYRTNRASFMKDVNDTVNFN